jgi:RNA polymerase sigma factor (TIGR02999 family)
MPDESVTQLLESHRKGDAGALDRAFEIVYDELRRLARHHLRGQRRGQTLDTTSLVHEVYLKLAAPGHVTAGDRAHFLALSSRAMRQVIVDYARSRTASKRGGNARRITLDTELVEADDQLEWILTLDSALRRIRAVDERLEQIVECRFFAGYSEEDAAEAMGVSVRTAQRDWRRAKAWLRESLAAEG